MTSTRRVSAVLATTHPIGAYGGIQLGKNILEQLADAMQTGTLPMVFNHDLRQRVDIANVTAGVRQRPDGHWEAWADFDVAASDWDRFESELAELGAPGGMSFKCSTLLARRGDLPVVRIAADAHHFTDDDLLQAGQALPSHVAVEVERLYSFSFVPPALVVVHLVWIWVQQMPSELLGAYLYDALRRFARPRVAAPTVFNFEVSKGDLGSVSAYLESASEAILHHALDTLAEIARSDGIFEYREGEWKKL